MSSQIEEACLRACNECAAACLECASACINETDPKPMARCMALDLECADICRLAAASIAKGLCTYASHLRALRGCVPRLRG